MVIIMLMKEERLMIRTKIPSQGTTYFLVILMIAAVVVGSRNTIMADTFKKSYPMQAGTTVGMVADIVREVAGERAVVKNIIGSGVDPHIYNPTRSDVATLLKSDIIFYAGLLLEGQMTDILVKVSRKRPVFAVTELLKSDYLIHDPDTNHDDPHVWMDVQGWMKAVSVVSEALATFDPAGKTFYETNATNLTDRMQLLDHYARKSIASIPEGQRILVTAHDAFNYLSRAYNIEVLGIQGLSTESEAGIKDINRIVDVLVERNIPAVFVESSVSDKNVKALIEGAAARGHQVKIGGELFSDAMGPPGTYEGTYVGMIDHNVTVIAEALGGNVPHTGMQGKLTRAH